MSSAALCAAKPDDELLAMLEKPDDWTPEMIAAAGAELSRRGVAHHRVERAPETSAWGAWAVLACALVGLSVWAISAGWGPSSAALFVLPAAAATGQAIRAFMLRPKR